MMRFAIACALVGCVTRAQVCVEYAHSLGPRQDYSRVDSVGASVCTDVERP